MSGKESNAAARAKAEAEAEVQKIYVPQMFSHPKHLTGGAEDAGGLDTWMMTNLPADILIPLTMLELIGKEDSLGVVTEFVDLMKSGLKAINGFAVKQAEAMYVSRGNNDGRKQMKKPGWFGRNVTNRNFQQKAEQENSEIVE